MTPALGLVLRVIPEMNQRIVPLAGLHHTVAAAAAIAARGTSARHKLLPPKGHTAIPAIAGFHQNLCFINEHRTKSQLPIYPVYRKPHILARNTPNLSGS